MPLRRQVGWTTKGIGPEDTLEGDYRLLERAYSGGNHALGMASPTGTDCSYTPIERWIAA